MATPNEDGYGRGYASLLVWILLSFLGIIVAITREKGISFLKVSLGIELTPAQYFAGIVGILIVVVSLAKLLQYAYRETQQEAREAGLEEEILAQAKRGKASPPFFLYLRPFIPRGQLKYQDEDELEGFQSIVPFSMLPLENLETILGKALQPDRFLALGRKGEARAAAARFEVEDSQWQENLKILARHAKGILLLPATSDGSIWEMDYLHAHPGLLKKTIYLMPPKSQTLLETLKTKPSLVEEEWGLLHEAAQAGDVGFPPYSREGMLFTLAPNGKILRKAAPNWNRPSELGKAIRKLLAPAKAEKS
ncbi:MAG: hypothetical protein KDD19_20475 [Phaeodactylibacter sp.]|nr:hypothetical protein [Phaeodactylibacter sp.]MCB9051858.1 hypothetical protein [Lewinellaceae bacterium]